MEDIPQHDGSVVVFDAVTAAAGFTVIYVNDTPPPPVTNDTRTTAKIG